MDRPCAEFTPGPRLLEMCYHHHVPVTLASDAHKAEQIARHYESATALLSRVGYTEIVGFNGKITFATFGNDPVIVETKDGKQEYDLPNPVHIQQPLIQTIVDEIFGIVTCLSTGHTASRTNWAMDRILV